MHDQSDSLCDGVTSWVDEGRAVAFDIMYHNILIGKLRRCKLDEWTVQ